MSIVTGMGHIKAKSFMRRIAFFMIFVSGLCEVATGGDNGLGDFVPRLQ
jgi:hypothetical protein